MFILGDENRREKVAHLSLHRLLLLGLGYLARRRRHGPALASHHRVARGAEMGSVVLHAVVLTREATGAALVGTLVVLLAGVDAHVPGQMSGGGERPAAVAHVLLSLLVVGVVEVHVHNRHRLGLVKRGRLWQRGRSVRVNMGRRRRRHLHHGRRGWWWRGRGMDHLGLNLNLSLSLGLWLVVVHRGRGGVVDVSNGRQWALVVENVFERHGSSWMCV
jgi:hypothetical protein